MKTTKLLSSIVIGTFAVTCNSAYASGNQHTGNPSMQVQGENLVWLKDRFSILEEKVLTSTIDRDAATEFKVLRNVILETAEKAASHENTPSETLSKTLFFSGDANCVFGSTLAKIVNTQGRLQLGLSPSDCQGLTIDQIKKIDFSKLDLSNF